MKDFIYKSAEEISKMSAEEQNKYLADKNTHEANVRKQEIEDAVKAAKKEMEEGVITDLAEEIKTLGESIKTSFSEGAEDLLAKSLEENADKIKGLYGSGGVIEIKAPATITTQNGTTQTPPLIVGTELAPVSNVNLRRPVILDLIQTISTNQASYAYTEMQPKDGDYAFVNEGEVKPQIDFTWATKYATPKKIAAWLKLTEEAVQDVKGLESVARDYLRKKHDLFKAKAILASAVGYGRKFVAGAMASAISNPNFMDVVNAAIVNIATTHNYEDETPYEANLVLVNPMDFFLNLVSAKDNQGQPLYPTASLFNRVVIGGVTIIPDSSVAQGKVFVGDLSKLVVTNYMAYTVKIGWVNDDFIKNQFVILGESRFHVFAKAMDAAAAFIYDDIATIKTAITKP